MRTRLSIFCILIPLCCACCASRRIKVERLADEMDRLYRAYLEGDIAQKRQSLLQAVHELETVDYLGNPWSVPHGLWFYYSRLSVLEAKAGNEAQAASYLLKARYWLLRNEELHEVPIEQALQDVEFYTAEKCKELVESWDSRRAKVIFGNNATRATPDRWEPAP